MSRALFTIAYDGPALRSASMDVRDLAPALLAVGQLFDAANAALNDESAQVKINVTATGQGSFEIVFEIAQTLHAQLSAFFSSDIVTAAGDLKTLIVGTLSGTSCLLWLVRKLKGRKPGKIERLSDSHVRVTIDGESFDVPLKLMRLYQDIAVRTAMQKVVADPLKKSGIDKFEVREDKRALITIGRADSVFFEKPEFPEETLVEATRRAAFSIVSLAFKEDNKWRLYDGNTQISASIEDQRFLQRVDTNQIAFAKGDILICDVLITQKTTDHGLTTEYVVKNVVEHRPAMRQLPMPFEDDGA